MPVVAFFLFFFAYIVAAFYFTSLPFSSILPDSSSSPLVYSFSYSPVKFFRWAFTGLFFSFLFFFWRLRADFFLFSLLSFPSSSILFFYFDSFFVFI